MEQGAGRPKRDPLGGDATLGRRLMDSVVRRFRPQWIRAALAPEGYERFVPITRIDPLPAGRNLTVVAPHPDDESIGAGGLVACWTGSGRRAEVVFLTDGAAGSADVRAAEAAGDHVAKSAAASQTAAIRRSEAETALSILGAEGLWLTGTDGALWRDEARLAATLSAHWRDAPPDCLVVPFPADRHRDHAVAARLAAEAALTAGLSGEMPVLCYEVWSPCPVNAVLDVTAVAGTKARAIAAHASQTATTDYVTAMTGLNTYRAIAAGLPSDRLAEGYYRCSLNRLAEICARLKV